jgi:hypothetical protein
VRKTMWLVCVAATVGLTGCSLFPKDPPSHASKADFWAAIVARASGGPIPRWDTVRADLDKIHAMGTPAGSGKDARDAILRLSDIGYNTKDEAEARAQVDAFVKNDHGAQARAMTAYFGPYCAR